jgi:hypothetical protein
MQRDYVTRMRAVGTARDMLIIYAHAITGIQQRLAPVFLALRDAAVTDPDCAELWDRDLPAAGLEYAPTGGRTAGQGRPAHRPVR